MKHNSLLSNVSEKIFFFGDQPARDGATPAYIAAQSGFNQCLDVLAALGADMKRADNKGVTPLHQVRVLRKLRFHRFRDELIDARTALMDYELSFAGCYEWA